MAFIVTGGTRLRGAMKTMSDAADAATRKATATGAHLLEAEIKKRLSTSGSSTSGRRDTRGRFVNNIRHPSPPGQPPALQTGTLRRSIKVGGPNKLGPGLYQARIGPTAVYGRVQELGGMAGRGRMSRLPARPYVKPAFDSLVAGGRLADAYTSAWRSAMRLS